ncbi:hypothetical protein N7457_002295 [Penicillium paradoxum]|uniref:uncharacterized protein n=1 Tax=Penicillium paradoxum TaxID=176176 RepID=UPI002548F92D|nr:uncharacterized protein N7457_002295 [Penicillium paradoxum]KAJ5787305.1 hypothetical protein N7457_002295 [Penicillium paradoxum]
MLGIIKRALCKPRAEVYGLDHAILNIQLPPQAMWMNMGYWEHTNDFPEACEALLHQVLTAALSAETASAVRILDVGCGCGDQSLYLMNHLKDSASSSDFYPRSQTGTTTSSNLSDTKGSGSTMRSRHRQPDFQSSSLPCLDSYIGITLEPAQAALASRRLHKTQRESDNSIPAEIFCADAANPGCWTGELKQAVTTFEAPSTIQKQTQDISTWLLALDTLYHFRPSRLPLLNYAYHTLNASFMGFDLIISNRITWWEKILLRVVCWGTNSPFGNFISETEYVYMLVAAGYDPTLIEIRDITQHVFGGLADFIDRRVEEARPFGIKMGKFRVAKTAFAWWATGRIVRGIVVVARKKGIEV